MPLQTGAYLALSRKFCGQVNISEIFSLVRQTRNTRAVSRPAVLFMGSGAAAGRQKTFVGASDIRSVMLVPESWRRALQGRGPCTLRKRERTPTR
jgi:hypothetical protein